ncbi:MAG: DNA-methyltransferase [Desulfobulbaceae bacterium]
MRSQPLESPVVLTPFGLIESTITGEPYFISHLEMLFRGDCLQVLPGILSESIDTVFADPPFNLAKQYGFRVDDDRSEKEYIEWCKGWLRECIRVLKPGGALFVYNIPKWNIVLGSYLVEEGLTFRHWIAVNLKLSLPIPGRLYPSHYSLLYYTKGKPQTFRRIRTPIELCRHCGGEIKDYGGHRKAMNPNGVNLTDVWHDITPVRHRKFKSSKRSANQLSTKLLERVVRMTTRQGDTVLYPFGGSGTTFEVCERFDRQWIGIEIENCDVIAERLLTQDLEPHKSGDYVED